MRKNHFTTIFNGVVPRAVPPLPLEKAMEIFDRLADMEDIDFLVPEGCYARAHILCRRLMDMGRTPQKAWAFGAGKALQLYLDSESVQWRFHVAPTLTVQFADGTIKEMVMDPSIFNGPVSLAEWGAVMKADPDRLEIVPFGVPPNVGPRNCRGDYSGNDSTTAATDRLAADQMKEYLSYQGATPRRRKLFASQCRQQMLQHQAISQEGKTWVTGDTTPSWKKYGDKQEIEKKMTLLQMTLK